jgi:hypothetical protein
VNILSNNLTKILVLMDVAAITRRKIRQNIITSITIKLSFVVLIMLGYMSLWLAVGIGDMGVSLFVLLNGFTVLRYRSRYQSDEYAAGHARFTKLSCQYCQEEHAIPLHHGEPMMPQGDALVCWKSVLFNQDEESDCAPYSLRCETCQHPLTLE